MEELDLRRVLSANIKLYRNRREWSQIKLAEKLDISTNFLADIETGKSWVSSLTLVKLANVLDIEVFELFKPVQGIGDPANEEASAEFKELLTRLYNDMTISLEQSVSQTMKKSIENVFRQYFSQI
jgi:transcriptional regulator with XRE-family HTH domain